MTTTIFSWLAVLLVSMPAAMADVEESADGDLPIPVDISSLERSLIWMGAPGVSPELLAGFAAFLRLDYPAAMEILAPAALNGDALAAYFMGAMHDARYHRIPASPGGVFYQADFFDRDAAVQWYSLAAQADQPYAAYQLGWFNTRWGRPGLPGEALNLLKRRARRGDGIAAYLLAEGRLGPTSAIQWARLALVNLSAQAQGRSAIHQRYLAKLYQMGLVPRMREHLSVPGRRAVPRVRPASYAFAWFTAAAKHGDKHSGIYQSVVANNMNVGFHKQADMITREILMLFAD